MNEFSAITLQIFVATVSSALISYCKNQLFQFIFIFIFNLLFSVWLPALPS